MIVAFEVVFANIQLSSMKFERQKVVPDKYDLTNQQFLTFRNNPVTENSGRTVYSQQFDYRSLDRYDKPEDRADPAYNFRKNVKNLRSQDKYKQLKEEALLFQATEENNESGTGSVERREELKNRLAKLKKNLKREQKREGLLRDQVALMEGEVEQLEEANAKQREDVDELLLILRDNEKNIGKMSRRLDEYVNIEQEMEDKIDAITATIENEIKTNRSNESSSFEHNKNLTSGLAQLEQFSSQITEKIKYFEGEVERMKERLFQVSELDEELLGQLE